MLRLIPVTLALTLFFVPLRTTTQSERLPSADFPPQDFSLTSSVNAGFDKARAAKLLREAPGTLEAVRALTRAQDVAGTLASLRIIVDKYPERLADAFEVVGNAHLVGRRGDDEIARRSQQTMVEILADARQKLPSLPREDAARSERMFILLEAYPVITEIHFTNAERTKAAAKVTIGYSGATVEMEKEGGKWVARRLTNRWIT